MKNYRIGITVDQIEKHQLVTSVKAKVTGPEYKKHVARFGLKDAYELESMPPGILEDEIGGNQADFW